MATDRKFYYDFDSEIRLSGGKIIQETKNHIFIRFLIEVPEGCYIFLCPADAKYFPSLVSLRVNGTYKKAYKSEAFYVAPDYARFGVDVTLSGGVNELIAELVPPTDAHTVYRIEDMPFHLAKAEGTPSVLPNHRTLHSYPQCPYEDTEFPFSFEGFSEGIGQTVSPGRFGFSKGDGLLDCAMPSLGIVDKMFLCGQPKYQKPYRWGYSLLPEGMPLHGSFDPCDTGIENDDITVNHLSVNWSAIYKKQRFSCTYSLASPAILTERDDSRMRLSGLRFAGNYQSVLIPRSDGVEECPLDQCDICGMTENWLILFHATEFPDVPIMLVFDRNPVKMIVTRNECGRLLSVDFEGAPLMLSCTPFGIERFEPGQMPIAGAIRRARFWSRALLAYPISHKEYYKLNNNDGSVTIRQCFEYRYIKDAWGTCPLKTAPLPPPLSICKTARTPDAIDYEFPTKYGYLYGGIGGFSEYTIPMMPMERRFPLRNPDSHISELLSEKMEQFKHFSSSFTDRTLSYPYAGAHLEPFALASSMSFFMSETDREYFREKLKERLAATLDARHTSDYVVIDWGEMMAKNPDHEEVMKIYTDKTRKRMPLQSWFTRTEPFTGVTFHICYLNVNFFSKGDIKSGSQEEISNLKIPLIENDWGAGLTFYYLYLAALSIGSFSEIKKNWDLLKSVYSFFSLMHDFACMGTGYSDNGITWVEGANYGAFTGFVKMAEAVGDAAARDFGIYNAAKQFALRLAIMHSSVDYFPRYFDVEPWYVAKHFHEELAPDKAFQNFPNLYFGDLRRDAFYNFTTEGLYPEVYTGFRQFGGETYNKLLQKLEYAITNGLDKPGSRWGIIQQYTALLINRAHDRRCSRERFFELIEKGISCGLLIREWRGIHIYSRALPQNYYLCQLLAWLEMRDHKAWLEFWEETVITQAVYDQDIARIMFRYSGQGRMRLVFGVTQKPLKVCLNGKEMIYDGSHSSTIEVFPESEGILELYFS